ncbi:MAG TPA: polysaccharide deacetylase family protein [Gammaproteobacteria bacterium]|nr:polysaccharide deacetylase family protein [Gammaproteobacteria bacterium]
MKILKIIVILTLFYQSIVWASTPLGKPIRAVKTTEKIAFLSFDDGPSVPYTQQILDLLDKYKVKATFFVVGINVKRYPQIIQDIMKRGHEIGNHSLSHENFKNKSVDFVVQDLKKTDDLIKAQGYQKTIPFRAPFGILTKNLEVALRKLEKPHILFNFLPKDWENPSPQVIHDRVIERASPGFIITLHDGWKNRKNTVIATEMIIKTLQQKGYRFVTATEYLKYN